MSEVREKIYQLEGLGCANCAAKMERGVKALSGIEEAAIDFATSRLRVKFGGGAEGLSEKIQEVVKGIEAHVIVMDVSQEKRKEVHKHDHDHGHEHDHDHGHQHNHDGLQKLELLRIAAGGLLFGIALLLKLPPAIELALYGAAYLLSGGEVLLKSARNILRGEVFDENFLMSIATIGAFAIGEYPEGVAVMLFYQVGEFFQDIAVNKSRRSIKALLDIRPDYANLKEGSESRRVSPYDVKIGDVIIIKPGEKIPLDGTVVEGASMLDTSALTGESLPREACIGDEVLSGSINKNGLLSVKVTKVFAESTVSKILDLVQNASSKKAPTENFITKFARYYTPAVVIVAAALAVIPPLVISGESFSAWVYRALVFLVVSCPCALVVSIPLGFFGGIGGASRRGILIKGSNFLEALNSVDTVVFDKTGTLTKGVFEVTKVVPSANVREEELLETAAYAECHSNHPIALSIAKAYGGSVDKAKVEAYEEVPGKGIAAKWNGKQLLAGNARLLKNMDVHFDESKDAGSILYIALDKEYLGYILIADEVKADSRKAVLGLRELGVSKTVMLTGDSSLVANHIGRYVDMDEVHSELLPHQKVEKLEEIKSMKHKGKKVAFIGDGINDAPVLAMADIGIAMGGIGSDAAIEAADIVIMTDEPSKLVEAIQIARRTRSIVWQNILFAFGVKLIVLILGAGGLATMWEAVFADVGVALLAVLNAMRVMNVKKYS